MCKETTLKYRYNYLGQCQNYGPQTKSQRGKKLYCISTFKTPQYLIDILEKMEMYHNHSTQVAYTYKIPKFECKKKNYEKVLSSIHY